MREEQEHKSAKASVSGLQAYSFDGWSFVPLEDERRRPESRERDEQIPAPAAAAHG